MQKVIKHFLVSGHVQGVGFRAFVQRSAAATELAGWVRNLQDGRVEALVSGSEEQIRAFESLILRGPRLSRVAGLEERSVEGMMELKGFEIRSDGEGPWQKN